MASAAKCAPANQGVVMAAIPHRMKRDHTDTVLFDVVLVYRREPSQNDMTLPPGIDLKSTGCANCRICWPLSSEANWHRHCRRENYAVKS